MKNLSEAQVLLIIIGAISLSVSVGISVGLQIMKNYFKKRTPVKEKFDFTILFHTDAHPIGEHGTIYVDCPAKGWKANPISFVFQGVPVSPQMSLGLMTKLWDDCRDAGYIPIALRSYTKVYEAKSSSAPKAVSQLEKRVMESNARRTEEKRDQRAAQRDQKLFEASADAAAVPQSKSA